MIIAGVYAYFEIIAIPVIVLIAVMVIDYITGLINASKTTGISSRIGIFGIVKKCCYIALVGVGATVDYIISMGLLQIGSENNFTLSFGLLVSIWLIINELISILENLSKIGVPMPSFLMKLVKRLKNTVESEADSTIE